MCFYRRNSDVKCFKNISLMLLQEAWNHLDEQTLLIMVSVLSENPEQTTDEKILKIEQSWESPRTDSEKVFILALWTSKSLNPLSTFSANKPQKIFSETYYLHYEKHFFTSDSWRYFYAFRRWMLKIRTIWLRDLTLNQLQLASRHLNLVSDSASHESVDDWQVRVPSFWGFAKVQSVLICGY